LYERYHTSYLRYCRNRFGLGIDYGILLDHSGSMGVVRQDLLRRARESDGVRHYLGTSKRPSVFDIAKAAAMRLVSELHSDDGSDVCSVASFNDVYQRSGSFNSTADAIKAIGALEPPKGGRTRLWDSIEDMLNDLMGLTHQRLIRRKHLLVLTDGIDNLSGPEFNAAVAPAQKNETFQRLKEEFKQAPETVCARNRHHVERLALYYRKAQEAGVLDPPRLFLIAFRNADRDFPSEMARRLWSETAEALKSHLGDIYRIPRVAEVCYFEELDELLDRFHGARRPMEIGILSYPLVCLLRDVSARRARLAQALPVALGFIAHALVDLRRVDKLREDSLHDRLLDLLEDQLGEEAFLLRALHHPDADKGLREDYEALLADASLPDELADAFAGLAIRAGFLRAEGDRILPSENKSLGNVTPETDFEHLAASVSGADPGMKWDPRRDEL